MSMAKKLIDLVEKKEILTLKSYVSELYDTKSSVDKRTKIDRYIVEYEDDSGVPFRESFEVKKGAKPNIPKSGTHDELNKLKKQW